VRLPAITVAVLLAGCGPQAIGAAIYPDGKTYSYRTADGEDVLSYVCAAEGPGGSQDKRAAATHRLVDASLQAFAEREAKWLLAAIEAGRSDLAIAVELNARSEAWAEATAQETESRYGCVSLGPRDP
jgi:hypothetical protein